MARIRNFRTRNVRTEDGNEVAIKFDRKFHHHNFLPTGLNGPLA